METNIFNLTAGSFDEEVILEKNVPVLVDFWAEWCGPCKAIAPILEEFAKEYSGKIKVCKVNVEEETNDTLSAKYGIRGIPTLILFKQGQLITTHVGSAPKSTLIDLIKPHIQ